MRFAHAGVSFHINTYQPSVLNFKGVLLMKKENLFHRDFTLMVIGQIISLFGNSILRFSLSLFVLDQTGSAAAFGGILAISMIPTVLLSPFGGLLADRVNKRNIMVILDFTTAAVIVLFALFFVNSESLLPIALVMVLLSVIQSFYQPSVQASIPALTSDENLARANGTVIQVNALSNLLGPIIGGFLYGFLHIDIILFLSGVCFFLSATMELFLRIPFIRREKNGSILRTVRDDLTGAMRFLTHDNPQLFKLLGIVAALNLFLSALVMVGLPYLIKIYLGLSSQLYGFAEGALAIGSILGGCLAGIVAKKMDFIKSHKLLLIAGISLLPIGLAVISPGLPFVSYGVIVLSVVACMCCAALFTIFAQTFAQRVTPGDLLGKVFSLITVISICSLPIGQAMYGFLFDRFGGGSCIILFLACIASLVIALLTGKILKKIEPAQDAQPE